MLIYLSIQDLEGLTKDIRTDIRPATSYLGQLLFLNCILCNGQRTEQVKTRQVNPDRPLMGPSVNTFVGSPCRAENREINPRGGSRGRTRGPTRGPTHGVIRGATRGSKFAFACSARAQYMHPVLTPSDKANS